MNRAERKRQSKTDDLTLARGLDPLSRDPEPVAAMIRQLHGLFLRARRDKDIDPPVEYLHAKAEATLERLKETKLACRKGCAHCCHVWVSVSAPEVLHVAKRLRRRGGLTPDRVRAAQSLTGGYSFAVRALHPTPCPLLEREACSVYDIRPLSCRFTASPDDFACRRVMIDLAHEAVPVPKTHLTGRGGYELAIVIALKQCGLPHYLYEYNAALACALAHDNAEAAWLAGEDIFAQCRRDPNDVYTYPPVPQLQKLAFG